MSNRQFTLTIKACEILEQVPKRSRSKFVSDALVNYAKKTTVFDEYQTYESTKSMAATNIPKTKVKSLTSNSGEPATVNNKEDSHVINQKKKVKVDSGY